MTTETTPPALIMAKEVLDAVLAVKPTYGEGEFPPTEDQAVKVNQKVYHDRMVVIYLALTSVAAAARSEAYNLGRNAPA